MKKSTVTKIKKSSIATPAPSPFYSFMMKNIVRIVQLAAAVMVVVLAILVYRRSKSVIKDLSNADPEILKQAMFGDTPYLFYCNRVGKTENIPKQFSELNMILGSQMGFASINCSQVLPSGKDIWTRFKLKKEWRPTIFGTMPWSKPYQASPTYLKDTASMKKFVETFMTPKGTLIKSDKELEKFCGFGKSTTMDKRDIGETCLVLLKGKRHNKKMEEIERAVVSEYPKLKVAVVDATKHRLSFEDEKDLPADVFGLKIHALRNGTHHLSMVNPITWDYVSTFISSAVGSPLYDFHGDGSERTKLVKAGSGSSEPTSSRSNKRSSTGKAKSRTKTEEPTASEIPADGPVPGEKQEAETEAERIQRERARREEMERQEKAYLFEDLDEEEGDSSTDDEEEDIIEL